LTSLPIIIQGVKPFAQEMPMFLLRIASEVDFSNEIKSIQLMAEEIAFYYARYVDFLSLQAQAIEYGCTKETTF
jgi:hypothetical protein